jgi:hypothetical protein
MENKLLLAFFDDLSGKLMNCLMPKNIVSTLGFFIPNFSYLSSRLQNINFAKRYSHKSISKSGYEEALLSCRNLATLILVCFLGFSSQIYGQFAPVYPPTGGFAIDGGLRANTPTSPLPFDSDQGDWYPGDGGNGGSVFDNSNLVIAPATNETSGRSSNENYNSNDNVFTNGSKFNDYVSDLKWFTNSAPDKNDINNALYHVSRDGSNNQWIFISGDRLSTNGTSYIDFELLQGTITPNDDGTFTGTPVDTKANGGGRTKNDIIISMEYTNGGSKPNVYIYQWMLSGTKWSYQLVTLTSLPDLASNAFAETNRTGIEPNLPYLAFGGNTYQQFAFVEAAVNITYLLTALTGGDSCAGLNIQTLWVKTKASAASTAALKDFIDPIPVNFNFGSTDITAIPAKCADDNTAYLLSATPSGGVFSGPGVSLDSGSYYFTPSSAGGAGEKTINYSSADGSCTGSIKIMVNALPTITGTLGMCVGSTTQLTGSATKAALNPWVSATPSVATVDNDGLVTGVSVGISVITYTNSNGCQKTATVTVNALPTISGTLTMCVGFTTQLTGSGSPATSNPWVSATPSVATVSNTGLVTGVSSGTSEITYTDSNGCQKTTTVTVYANPSPPSVTYNAAACDETTFSITVTSITIGSTYTVKDKNGDDVLGLSPSSPHTAIAADGSSITFYNFPAGSGYQVSVSANGCGSGTTSCGEPDSNITGKMAPEEKKLDTETSKVGFDAYPVPFKDVLTIKYKFDYVSDVKIEVFNSQGKAVLSKNDTNSYLGKEISLDLHFNKGLEQVYIVKLTTNRGSSTKKVMSSR